jgi:PIN domain nuclease of toxin-antitoxin system
MIPPMLLDTCAAIWVANKAPVSDEFLREVQRAETADHSIYVSPISAWEIGMLVSRGRMSLPTAPERWFASLLQAPALRLANLPPNVLIAASYLPGSPPSDPADRILAATAREYGYTLVTRDRPLLGYAAQGHLQSLMC